MMTAGEIHSSRTTQRRIAYRTRGHARGPLTRATGNYSVHTSPETLALGEAGIEGVAARMKLESWVPLSASVR